VLTDSITIDLWLKVNHLTPNPDWEGIVTKGTSSWRLQATTGGKTVTFSTTGVGPNEDFTGTRNVNDGQWHHVAAVYDGSNRLIYVDGALDVSASASGLISQNSYPVCLGQTANAPGNYAFDGLIDEVSIYNRALSASEIRAIYLKQK
jgi:hypothetical protein